MKRLLASFLIIGFILWILPLGFFIKPSQEKTVCDGQRAMCMCHIMMKTADRPMISGFGLKAGTTNKENSSGGAGNYFVSSRPIMMLNLQAASFFENQSLSYKNPFLAALEYVPKF